MKQYLAKSGAIVNFEDLRHKGFYAVMLLDPLGNIYDRVVTDSYQSAIEYRNIFIKIAKNLFRK
jgi:hypothetical protein